MFAHSFQRLALATFFASALAAPAGARDQPGLRACYGIVHQGRDNADIRLMRVTTQSQRLPFYRDRTERTPHCPAEVDHCQMKSFVVAGDLLLIRPVMEDFACGHFIAPALRHTRSQFRETIGFIPLSELTEVTSPVPRPPDWRGAWHRGADAEIRIEPEDDGRMAVHGSATFGAFSLERVKRGPVVAARIEGLVAAPSGNLLALGEGYDGVAAPAADRPGCSARLRLFGPYLVVEDNGGCGAGKAGFTGVYMRPKEQQRP